MSKLSYARNLLFIASLIGVALFYISVRTSINNGVINTVAIYTIMVYILVAIFIRISGNNVNMDNIVSRKLYGKQFLPLYIFFSPIIFTVSLAILDYFSLKTASDILIEIYLMSYIYIVMITHFITNNFILDYALKLFVKDIKIH